MFLSIVERFLNDAIDAGLPCIRHVVSNRIDGVLTRDSSSLRELICQPANGSVQSKIIQLRGPQQYRNVANGAHRFFGERMCSLQAIKTLGSTSEQRS